VRLASRPCRFGVAHEAAAGRAERGGAESAGRWLSAVEEERKGEAKALTRGVGLSGETRLRGETTDVWAGCYLRAGCCLVSGA